MKDNFKILYFGASSCYQCKAMMPQFLKEVKALGIEDYEIIEADNGTAESDDLVAQYNIRNLPTLIFLDGEREIGRESGYAAYQYIRKYYND